METLIVFRHGESELNRRSRLTGEAADQAYREGLPSGIEYTADLTDDGERHAHTLKGLLAYTAIDLCVSSPYLRARHTAEIALDEKIPPEDFEIADELVERNRGLFQFLPDEIATRLKETHPEYIENRNSTLRRRHKDGETLIEVMERLYPVVTYADRKVPHGTVAFSAHADVMTALRALIGQLSDERLAAPLVPTPPDDIRPLKRTNWNSYCQTDIYTKRNPATGVVAPRMTHFQTIGIVPRPFESGWLELPGLRG